MRTVCTTIRYLRAVIIDVHISSTTTSWSTQDSRVYLITGVWFLSEVYQIRIASRLTRSIHQLNAPPTKAYAIKWMTTNYEQWQYLLYTIFGWQTMNKRTMVMVDLCGCLCVFACKPVFARGGYKLTKEENINQKWNLYVISLWYSGIGVSAYNITVQLSTRALRVQHTHTHEHIRAVCSKMLYLIVIFIW